MDLEKYRAEADKYFGRIPKTHNCAQAVVQIAGRDDLVPPMAAFGGGRAEGGYCGALYGAMQVLPEAGHDELKKRFEKAAGALLCKEIKSGAKTPCRDCVAIAAAIADELKESAK